MTCYYCGLTQAEVKAIRPEDDLRPYGPNAAPICWRCMKSDPTREAEAIRQLHLQIVRAMRQSDCGVVQLTDRGFVPVYTEGGRS